MLLHLMWLLPLCAAADVLDTLRSNGILYDTYGEGRLIDNAGQCVPWKMDLFDYVNGLNPKQMTSFGKMTLKRRLYHSFANICSSFNVSTDTTQMPSVLNSSVDNQLRFMDRFELAWNQLKFERDLKSLFLEHKLNAPFMDLVKPADLLLASATDAMDFSHKTTIIPTKCSVAQLQLETTICYNFSEPSIAGPIYALVHTGQFTNDEQAFVYYDIPQYALVHNDELYPVNVKDCKVVFGQYIYCFTRLPSTCNMTSLEGCQRLAVRAGPGFTQLRPFGDNDIVATTMNEFDAVGNGTMFAIPSPQFIVRFTYTEEDGQVVIDDVNMVPVDDTVQTQPAVPFLMGDALQSLSETPQPVFLSYRKTTPFLSHKKPRPGFLDGVRNFFKFL